MVNKKLKYLNVLEGYLRSKNDFINVPAPSIAGIEELNIVNNVSQIIELSVKRSSLKYSLKECAPAFYDLDTSINSLKTVLLENIFSYRSALNIEKKSVDKRLDKIESELSTLPEDQQQLINIERKYNLSSELYDLFLGKRSEAALIKAANVSDLITIDEAKDVGGGLIGPDKQLNYIIAIGLSFLLPTLIIVVLFLLNNKITGPEDIGFLTKIPILGVVGKSNRTLVAFERPNSPVTEAFRSIRTSLKFIYNKQGIKGSKVVMITSSVSGEGKTFTSINLASVYAMSGKKTVLVGLDLRKPKIFNDFNLHNE